MKNTIYSLIFLAATSLFTTGCSDFFDKIPTTSLPTEIAINSYQDAQAALNGLYNGVQGSSDKVDWYGAVQIYRGDVSGDMMSVNGTGKRSSSCYELSYNTQTTPNIWDIPYNVIRQANNIINSINLGKVTDGDTKDVDHIKGQALAIRALAHFDLVRNYSTTYTADNGASLGIPIVTDPLMPEATPARNTVAEVYTQVIKDLKSAIELMNTTKTAGFLNQQGAKALLARVYLYKGDNENAFNTAVDVINNGEYSLWTNTEYASAWASQGSVEKIWEIINFSSDDWTDREGIAYLMLEEGYNDIILSKKAATYFTENPNDVRNKVLTSSKEESNITNYGDSKVWLLKYPAREGETDVRIGNVTMLRLSEQYLIAAEAAFKRNDQINADKYLNDIRKRANPDAADVTATLENILWEKAIEMIGEGHRFYDLLRNNLTVDRSTNWANCIIPAKQSVTFNRDYFRAILPIPQSEMNTNKEMEQNPGYAK